MYYIYMYEEDLELNNLQWLICQKTKLNQTNLLKDDLKIQFKIKELSTLDMKSGAHET